MKFAYLAAATLALVSSAANAQNQEPPKAPMSGSPAAASSVAPAPPSGEETGEPRPAEPTLTTETVVEPGGAGRATFTVTTVTNGPIPDTPENRAKYGEPLSRAGKMTPPRGD